MMDDADRERIRRDPTFGGDEPLDDTALLHRNQETDPAYSGPGLNLRFLMDTISEATAQNAGARFHVLAGVTPAGWAVLLASLITDALRRQPSIALHAARSAIDSIAVDLMAGIDPTGEAPWDDLAPLASKLTKEKMGHVFAATKELDQAMGIVVESRRSELFRLHSDSRTGLAKVETDSGSYQFPSWRVNYDGLHGERQGGVEQKPVGERYVFRWSQAVVSGRLLDIGVVNPHLARLSDLEASDFDGLEPTSQSGGELPFASELKPVVSTSPPGTIPRSLEGGQLHRHYLLQNLVPIPSHRRKPVRPPNPLPAIRSAEIQRLQERSWASRPEKAGRHARVAFFQWNLDETYRHPVFDACLRGFPREDCLDSDKHEVKYPERWNEPGEPPSCVEHRRRALLKSVLRACRAFKVDILLLPEYSIRPDTAAWLRMELPELAPTTSVWAGTYRQPPNMRLKVDLNEEQPSAWSAVMPIILAPAPGEPSWRVRLRRKKYLRSR